MIGCQALDRLLPEGTAVVAEMGSACLYGRLETDARSVILMLVQSAFSDLFPLRQNAHTYKYTYTHTRAHSCTHPCTYIRRHAGTPPTPQDSFAPHSSDFHFASQMSLILFQLLLLFVLLCGCYDIDRLKKKSILMPSPSQFFCMSLYFVYDNLQISRT